ncbi:MAG: hypothetical protein QOI76_4259 [Frankiales bacterium]|nr:hypothetical protein [Frankiales bacterium]
MRPVPSRANGALDRLPSCVLSQLRAAFAGAEPGAGNIIAAITLRNPGPAPCRLDRPVLLRGLDASGHAVRQSMALQSAPASPVLVLTARTLVPAAGSYAASGHTMAVVPIVGEYRDGPSADGRCPAGDEVRPVSWELTLGGQSTLVPNSNPHAANGPGGVEACLGAFHTAQQSHD